YAEKSSAALLATVLDVGREAFVADLGGSLRAGATGIRLAGEAVGAGAARGGRAGAGGDGEPFLGDGAAAVVIGEGDGVLARFEGAYSSTHEFSDVWRKADARFPEQGDPT